MICFQIIAERLKNKFKISSGNVKHKVKTIRSDHHVVSSYEINKTSLSCFDDKRYILDDRITSYAYGHWRSLKI